MTEAQLRGGRTPEEDTGELHYGPLEQQLEEFFTTDRWWKISFDLPSGRPVRIVRREDGSLMPTFWDDARENWFPRSGPPMK